MVVVNLREEKVDESLVVAEANSNPSDAPGVAAGFRRLVVEEE